MSREVIIRISDREYKDYYANDPSTKEVIRCKDCKYKFLDDMVWNCPFGLSGGENFFCSYGAKDGDTDE